MDSDIIITETPSLQSNNITPSMSPSDSVKKVVPFSWSTIFKYFMIILIIAFLGFNIFTYLGKGTETVTDIFRPVLSFFGLTVGETVKQTVEMTAEGTKDIIDIGEKATESAIDVLEKGMIIDKDKKMKKKDKNISKERKSEKNDEIIEHSLKDNLFDNITIPDDTHSKIQSKEDTIGKAGFCYIGEDRGYRSCISVSESQECMSGDIFPTREICINPNLRK